LEEEGEDRRSDLSVVLCTYEGARWLPPMLASLAAQTRLPDELIVGDDGSSDGTLDLLRSFERTAPFAVSVEVNDVRLGPTRNFERALGRATGAVVALADQDDVWHPGKLRRTMELLDEDPTISLLFSDAGLIDARGRPTHRRSPIARPSRSLWAARDQRGHLRAHPVVEAGTIARRPVATGCTMVVRRRAIDLALPFPEVLDDPASPMGHDRWIALVAATIGTVVALDERLLDFRVHDDQATGLDRPTVRARRLRRTAQRAATDASDEFVRAHLVAAQQLEAAAARGDCGGDEEAARELAAVARHHRHRAETAAMGRHRTRAVLAEARQGGYGHDGAAVRAVAADVVRALGAAARRGSARR